MMHEGHDHGHEHTHTHTHADGTVHTHSHDHSHGENHEHCHHGEGTVSEQTMALLSYMLDHNRDHAAEVHELAHKLEHEGRGEEAELIHKGVALYNEGNDQLARALAKLRGEDA